MEQKEIKLNPQKTNTEERAAFGEYVTLQEAADILGCSAPALTRVIKTGNLPARQMGRRYLVNLSTLQRWANGEEVGR